MIVRGTFEVLLKSGSQKGVTFGQKVVRKVVKKGSKMAFFDPFFCHFPMGEPPLTRKSGSKKGHF